MTSLIKTVRRVTLDTYGYGNDRRRLVAAFEKGDLITIREFGRRTKEAATICDVLWWMKRCKGRQNPHGETTRTQGAQGRASVTKKVIKFSTIFIKIIVRGSFAICIYADTRIEKCHF